MHSPSVSKETVSLIVYINCIGWSSFASIFLWFVAILTDKKKLLQSKRFYVAIFFFPAFFIFAQWKGLLVVDWVKQPWGWASVWTDNYFDYLYYAYYLSFMITALVMLFRFRRITTTPLKKKQAGIILISTIIPLTAGTFTDVVLPKITILSFPDLANIFTLIWVTGVVMSIVRYNFFHLTPAMAEFTTVFNQTLEQGRSVVYRKNFNLNEYEYLGEGIIDIIGYQAREITPTFWDEILINAEIRGEHAGMPHLEANRRMREGSIDYWLSDSQLRTKSGEIRWIMDMATSLRDRSGHCYGCLGILFDITDRKEAEQKLAQTSEELRIKNQDLENIVRERTKELSEEKELLDVTLRSIGDGVITTGTDGKIFLLNKAAEKLTGWSRKDAAGKSLHDIFTIVDEKKRLPCDDPVKKVLNAGAVVYMTENCLLVAKDGTEKMIADSVAPIRDNNGTIIGAVLVFSDVTEKRKMEEELMKNQKLESLGILAGGIAHDFRNILTGILGNIWLARKHADDPEYLLKRLVEGEKATIQAKDLTEQLLTYSKGGAPVKRVVSIRESIYDTVIFVLRGSPVKEKIQIPDDLWHVEIDTGQISQVIQNIAINAKQAMPQGGNFSIKAENIHVTKERNLPLKEGDYIRVTFTDEGTGIPKKHLQKIFDPFFTTKQKGSGLGLATSHSIIQKHDGHISVESKMDEGTTFTLFLTAVKEYRAKEEIPQKETLSRGSGRVLIMDDERVIRETLSELLAHFGYEATCVNEGSEAVKKYKKAQNEGKTFDAVILDLTVPGGMGGEETIKKLIMLNPHIRAIAASGYSNEPVMADFAKYGFCAAAIKPFDIEELHEKLSHILNK